MGKSQKPAAEQAVSFDVFNVIARDNEVYENFVGTALFHPETGLSFDLNLQIQKLKDRPDFKGRNVFNVIDRGEGKTPLWEEVGTAWENKKNPDNLSLRLNLRSKVKKDA